MCLLIGWKTEIGRANTDSLFITEATKQLLIAKVKQPCFVLLRGVAVHNWLEQKIQRSVRNDIGSTGYLNMLSAVSTVWGLENCFSKVCGVFYFCSLNAVAGLSEINMPRLLELNCCIEYLQGHEPTDTAMLGCLSDHYTEPLLVTIVVFELSSWERESQRWLFIVMGVHKK